MQKEEQDLFQKIEIFKKNHYKNIDTLYWQRKIDNLHSKFRILKDVDKQNKIILELCTSYLQMLEILFINAHALSVKLENFPAALFIDSRNLLNFISDRFYRTSNFSTWFLTNYIFVIQKGDKDYRERFETYSNLIKECAKDYLDYYDLLNAYKHGYRISAKYGKSTLTLVTNDKKQFPLTQT